jgi:hypothetical protein
VIFLGRPRRNGLSDGMHNVTGLINDILRPISGNEKEASGNRYGMKLTATSQDD